MTTGEFVASAIGGAGLLLGLCNAWVHHRESSPRIRVQTLTEYRSDRPDDTYLVLKAVNYGRIEVNLTNCGIRMPDGKDWVFHSTGRYFPFLLGPQRSHQAYLDYAEVADAAKRDGFGGKIRFRSVFQDETGRSYYESRMKSWRRKHRFDVDLWASDGSS